MSFVLPAALRAEPRMRSSPSGRHRPPARFSLARSWAHLPPGDPHLKPIGAEGARLDAVRACEVRGGKHFLWEALCDALAPIEQQQPIAKARCERQIVQGDQDPGSPTG